MYRWFLLASFAVLVGLAGAARGNGRPPATSTIHFRQGQETDIAVGLTFGLILSHDGGKTWSWICEDDFPYQGNFDPVYAYDSSGALFATTFQSLRVLRDGCSFENTVAGTTFVSTNALDSTGAFYYAAAQVADSSGTPAKDFKIYKLASGASQATGVEVADPADTNVWWQSILPAPSDPQVVYLSGYRYVPAAGGSDAGTASMREQLLFRSDNGGATWTKLPMTGLEITAANAKIDLLGVVDSDPKHLYARVEYIDNLTTDAVYVSTNSGVTWTEIRRKADRITAFVVRGAAHAHDLVLGTATSVPEISHNDGTSWSPLDGAPHAGCLVENAAGEVWACTQNYDIGTTPSDGAGMIKSTDLATWTKVLRYQDLTNAVSCAAGTIQHDTCEPAWCAYCNQLGCKPAATSTCIGPEAQPAKSGCCGAGSDPGGPLALGLSVATVLLRRRRQGEST